jgi:hypothetical protein
MNQNIKEISSAEGIKIENSKVLSIDKFENIRNRNNNDRPGDQTVYPKYFHLVVSISYALFLSIGSILWFYLITFIIVHFRQKINIVVISVFIKSLGAVLGIFGLYFGYLAAGFFLK